MDFSLYDQLLSPVIVLNQNNNIIYYNFTCSTFFHLSPRKLSKITKVEELFQKSKINLNDYIQEVRNNKQFTTTPEFSFEVENGEEITVILKFLPQEENIIINLIDFSIEYRLQKKYRKQLKELKESHEQIVSAEKLASLGQLVSSIGHEISTPLIIINDHIEALKNAIKLEDQETSFVEVEKIESGINRVVKVFNNLKTIIKNKKENTNIVCVEKACENVKDFFVSMSLLKGIELQIKVKNERLWVIGNEVNLEQVLINLVTNSAQAIKIAKTKNPQICIEAYKDETSQAVVIKINDNGPGIDSSIKDKIFDIFFSTKEDEEGTGLGLALCKKLIKPFSGEIKLNDKDVGCEFELTFPIVEMGSFVATNKYLSGESAEENQKILIVGKNINEVKEVYNFFTNSQYITTVTNELSNVDMLVDFFMIDFIVSLEKTKGMTDFEEVLDLSDVEQNQRIKDLESRFGN